MNMQTLIIYFIKVNIVISIYFLIYLLILRNEKFFKLNRFLLLSILVSAFILPLITVSSPIRTKNKIISQLDERLAKVKLVQSLTFSEKEIHSTNVEAKQIDNNGYSNFSFSQIAVGVYLLIAFILFVHFVLQLIQLLQMLKGNETKVVDGVVLG